MAGLDQVDPANSCDCPSVARCEAGLRLTPARPLQFSDHGLARPSQETVTDRRLRSASAVNGSAPAPGVAEVTARRKIGTAKPALENVLQFAPNFAAYLLPPDVVCFYSEDRKFFLHGELYCALVSAI